jgi:hypothetical protein
LQVWHCCARGGSTWGGAKLNNPNVISTIIFEGMSSIPYKGKTSMANKSEQLEQVVSSPEVRTIRLLQNKYGEELGSVHTEVGETKSGLFWKLES